MKIFITVELEGETSLDEKLSKEAYFKLMEMVDMLRKDGIPVQYKETNLPRYRTKFRALGDLDKIQE